MSAESPPWSGRKSTEGSPNIMVSCLGESVGSVDDGRDAVNVEEGGAPDEDVGHPGAFSRYFGNWRQLYKNRSSRKIDSRRLFSREKDFPKTFSLTENQFSGKTYFYAIASRDRLVKERVCCPESAPSVSPCSS